MIRRIVVVQVVLYLLLVLINGVLTLVSPMRWWNAGSLLAFQPTVGYLMDHPWTLLTYIIPHDSLFHIMGTALLLSIIERTLEERLLPWRVLVLYLYGALAGALADLLGYYLGGALGLWTPLPRELVGSQPAVLSLLAASLTLHIRKRDTPREYTIVGASLVIMLAVACLGMSSWKAGLGGHLLAHVGGITCGIVFALLLSRGIDLTAPIAKPLGRALRRIFSSLEDKVDSGKRTPEDETPLTQLRQSGYESLSEDERRRLDLIRQDDTKQTH